MTNQIKIITDSTCDIPAAWQEQYDISVIPLTIVWGDEQFLDGVDMMPEAFYERLSTDKAHPTTSQPTPKSFMEPHQAPAHAGRSGDAVKFLGSLLNIKPLIFVNHETGTVGASIPGRSRASGIRGLYKQFFKNVDTSKKMHITVLHNAALEEAEALAEKVKAEFDPDEIFISIVSPILGVHTGPKAIALCGYYE